MRLSDWDLVACGIHLRGLDLNARITTFARRENRGIIIYLTLGVFYAWYLLPV